jgi:hypothetical protein
MRGKLMSVLGIYYAIPPGSSLYHGFECKPSLMKIAKHLFSFGNGIYRSFNIEPDVESSLVENELRDFTENVCGTSDFPTESNMQQAIAEYCSEVILTRQNYPGIENRCLVLDGMSIDIQKRLKPELLRRQIENAAELVNKIFYGDKLIGCGGEAFEVISRQVVSQGANILPQINAKTLFSPDQGEDAFLLESFEALRNLYLDVDANNEEILVSYE